MAVCTATYLPASEQYLAVHWTLWVSRRNL